MAWFAIYTSSRAEKKVKEKLDVAEIVNYLPLRKDIRIWSDRKKKIEVPLIPGYLFVNVFVNQFVDVLKIEGVVTFLREKGKPAMIPDAQIERLKLMAEYFSDGMEFSNEMISPGDQVKLKMNDKELYGEMVEFKGKYQMVVRLDNLGCALITIPMSLVQKI